MSDRLFRLRLHDGTTWAVCVEDVAGARAKAEKYFPHEHVTIEESVGGAPWRVADPGCASCSHGEVMPDLGHACDVSCGTDKYPTEAE